MENWRICMSPLQVSGMSEVGKHLLRGFWRWPEELGGGRMCFRVAFVSVFRDAQPLWTLTALPRTESSLQCREGHRSDKINSSDVIKQAVPAQATSLQIYPFFGAS